jgi:hypothetical protein
MCHYDWGVWVGVIWSSGQVYATGRRFGCKTQKIPIKYDKLLKGFTLFPPAAEICAELAGNFCQ